MSLLISVAQYIAHAVWIYASAKKLITQKPVQQLANQKIEIETSFSWIYTGKKDGVDKWLNMVTVWRPIHSFFLTTHPHTHT